MKKLINVEKNYYKNMITLIKALLAKWSCLHDWKVYREIRVLDENNNPIKFEDTLFCKKCGKIKKIKL